MFGKSGNHVSHLIIGFPFASEPKVSEWENAFPQ